MTKHTENDAPQGHDRPLEIVVTPQMIEAGLEEMREHHYGEDVRYMVECVFRAMAYAQ